MKPRVRASFIAAGGLVLATALGDDLADHLAARDRAYTELMKLPAWRPASRIVITVDKGEKTK